MDHSTQKGWLHNVQALNHENPGCVAGVTRDQRFLEWFSDFFGAHTCWLRNTWQLEDQSRKKL